MSGKRLEKEQVRRSRRRRSVADELPCDTRQAPVLIRSSAFPRVLASRQTTLFRSVRAARCSAKFNMRLVSFEISPGTEPEEIQLPNSGKGDYR